LLLVAKSREISEPQGLWCNLPTATKTAAKKARQWKTSEISKPWIDYFSGVFQTEIVPFRDMERLFHVEQSVLFERPPRMFHVEH
jgi:hypothetical protein